MTDPDSTENSSQDKTDKVLNKALESYKWWNNLSKLNAQDPIWLSVLKLGARLIGVLFLLAISPLIILGLIVGITAAF